MLLALMALRLLAFSPYGSKALQSKACQAQRSKLLFAFKPLVVKVLGL
jgi:hypothetical protein